MAVRVLIDTNVLLDYLLDREPYGEMARWIVKACQRQQIFACVASHSISNIFFILRKDFTIEERRTILLDICELFDVEGINKDKLQNALVNEDFQDFEDCLQMECAISYHADYIVTRNLPDFKSSIIPCLEPEQFYQMMNDSGKTN